MNNYIVSDVAYNIMKTFLLSMMKGVVYRASGLVSGSVASSVVLGRWGIQYDPNIIRIKIDQANEDHCGCCGEPGSKTLGRITSTVPSDIANTKKTRYEKREEYLVPYVLWITNKIEQATSSFFIIIILYNNMKLNFDVTKYTGVMVFYAVLTYILFPAIAYFLFGKTLEAAGNGFIIGSIASIVLWKFYGSGLVKGV